MWDRFWSKKELRFRSKKNWKIINIKNGVLGRFWADLDCRFEFYVKNYVGWWVQICFLSIFENLVIRQFGYPAFYQAISIKSTFEPITTPLKWVLADAAWKVSASVENFASVWAGKCKMVPKHWILLESFAFHDLKYFREKLIRYPACLFSEQRIQNGHRHIYMYMYTYRFFN